MGESDGQTPWQTLRKSKPHMSPRTHVPHHRHPTYSLAEERAGRIIVWYGLHRVRKQFDFKALLRDQTANQKIVGGLVFNRLVSAKSSKVRTGGNNGRSQGELNSIQLPSDQNSRIEVGIHADALQMLRERFIVNGLVEAGHATHFRVRQRRDNRAQVIRLDPDIAV